MRIGLLTPVVTAVPGGTAPWEATAGPDELAAIAESADGLGFDHLTCSEHVAVPADAGVGRGTTYWDPLATLAFLAARTRRIRLVTAVLVLPYHHPVALAKRYGTLDRLSGGRVVLGVGVGSLREEFDLLGAAWDSRGRDTDERLRRLREVWGAERSDGFVIAPTAPRRDVALWVGGRTARSLRRACDLGDGWMPFGLTAAEIAGLLATADPPPGFDVVLATGRLLDPLGDPAGTKTALDRLAGAGATAVSATLGADSAEHYRDQLAALHQIAVERGDMP